VPFEVRVRALPSHRTAPASVQVTANGTGVRLQLRAPAPGAAAVPGRPRLTG
jgi:hypothetical protein